MRRLVVYRGSQLLKAEVFPGALSLVVQHPQGIALVGVLADDIKVHPIPGFSQFYGYLMGNELGIPLGADHFQELSIAYRITRG
jgi:hypothetical protein